MQFIGSVGHYFTPDQMCPLKPGAGVLWVLLKSFISVIQAPVEEDVGEGCKGARPRLQKPQRIQH